MWPAQLPWLLGHTQTHQESGLPPLVLYGNQSLLDGVTKLLVLHFPFSFLNLTYPEYLVTCQDIGILISCIFS